MEEQIQWNKDMTIPNLVTKNEDGSITSEPITIEEATQWTAENKF